MADLKTDLAECVRLHGKATPERWIVKDDCMVVTDVVSKVYRAEIAGCPEPDDAAAIAALHNLFHDHGDELLAAVEDAEQFRGARRMLWAVLVAAGGSVIIPRETLIKLSDKGLLERRETPDGDIRVTARFGAMQQEADREA